MCVVLKEDGRRTTQIGQFKRFDILIVYENCTFGGIIQSRYQFQDGALSRTVHAYDDLKISVRECI